MHRSPDRRKVAEDAALLETDSQLQSHHNRILDERQLATLDAEAEQEA